MSTSNFSTSTLYSHSDGGAKFCVLMHMCSWGSIVSHWTYVCFLPGTKIICSFHGFPSDMVLGLVVQSFQNSIQLPKGQKKPWRRSFIRVEINSVSHITQRIARNLITVSFKGVAFKCRFVDKSSRNNCYHTYNESRTPEHTHHALHNIHTSMHWKPS
jgi:hypothetical protein